MCIRDRQHPAPAGEFRAQSEDTDLGRRIHLPKPGVLRAALRQLLRRWRLQPPFGPRLCLGDAEILVLNPAQTAFSEDFQSMNSHCHSPTSMRPVSYTHLRAHETVLDLVCRLLLA